MISLNNIFHCQLCAFAVDIIKFLLIFVIGGWIFETDA